MKVLLGKKESKNTWNVERLMVVSCTRKRGLKNPRASYPTSYWPKRLPYISILNPTIYRYDKNVFW